MSATNTPAAIAAAIADLESLPQRLDEFRLPTDLPALVEMCDYFGPKVALLKGRLTGLLGDKIVNAAARIHGLATGAIRRRLAAGDNIPDRPLLTAKDFANGVDRITGNHVYLAVARKSNLRCGHPADASSTGWAWAGAWMPGSSWASMTGRFGRSRRPSV